MPLSDLPLSILFAIFLMLFVLIGILPAWKRTGGRIRAYLRARRRASWTGRSVLDNAQPTSFDLPQQTLTLNDFEIFILRRLAQAGSRGLSRRQLAAEFHFDSPIMAASLTALRERDLVELTMPVGFGTRFRLSAKGREFAVSQGYLPKLSVR